MTLAVRGVSIAVLAVGAGGCVQIGDLGRTAAGEGPIGGEGDSMQLDVPAMGATETSNPGIPSPFAIGADISFRNLLDDLGAVYYDDMGTSREVLAILADHGFDLARIRLFHDPGQPTLFTDGQEYRLHDGYQDVADGVRAAELAHEHGFPLFLTFHYSDFWTNPEQQVIPAAWAMFDEFEDLADAVFDDTASSLQAFRDTGATIRYVGLGHSINDRLMGYESSSPEYGQLLARAAGAVRTVAPDTKIVLDFAADSNRDAMLDRLGRLRAEEFDYDVIGLSLYPFWTGWSLEQMQEYVIWLAGESGKPVLISEFGALWAGESQGPYDFAEDDPFTISPEGQRDYIAAYLATMRASNVVEGVVYWDPIWIDWPDAGWVVGQGNPEWDSALFDGGGRELPALDVFLLDP